jgi:hypothetical protein
MTSGTSAKPATNILCGTRRPFRLSASRAPKRNISANACASYASAAVSERSIFSRAELVSKPWRPRASHECPVSFFAARLLLERCRALFGQKSMDPVAFMRPAAQFRKFQLRESLKLSNLNAQKYYHHRGASTSNARETRLGTASGHSAISSTKRSPPRFMPTGRGGRACQRGFRSYNLPSH